MTAPLVPEPPPPAPTASVPDADRPRTPRPLPWTGRGERADKVLLGLIALSGLLPLIPALVSSHPALLEFVRGSTASIINMGARARIG